MQKLLVTILILFFFSKTFSQQGFSAGADKDINCLQPTAVLEGKIPNPNYSFSWSSDKGFYSTNLTPIVSVPGAYYFQANYQGKFLKDTVLVLDKKLIPQAHAGEDKLQTCLFPEVILNPIDPGIGFGTYWTGPNNFKSNQLHPKISVAGLYRLEVFKGFCSSFDTVLVKDAKKLEPAQAGKDLLINCTKPTAKLQAIFPGQEITFEWIFKEKTISTDLQPIVNQEGIYCFKIKQGDCESTDSLEIKGDFRKPELSGVVNYQMNCVPPYCMTTDVKVRYENDATFTWRDVKNQPFSTQLNPLLCEAGVFTLKSKLAINGCEDNIKITISKQDSIRFVSETEGACEPLANGSITISKMTGGNQPYVFSLDNIDFQKDIHFKNLKIGDYTIFVKDKKGCKSSTSIKILPRKSFVWDLPSELEFCSYDKPLTIDATVKDNTAGEVLYTWSDGSTSSVRTFVKSENLRVEAKGECFSAVRNIMVNDKFDLIRNAKLYAPNIFNPESVNAENVTYRAFPAFPMLDYQLSVFDKSGQLLFQGNQPNAAWDGTFAGKKLLPDLYIWHIKASMDACGLPLPFVQSGSVMLMRN